MSEFIRVRLEFNRFSSPELRNCLLSINTLETKDINSLKKVIQKRHKIKENLLLCIDGFVLADNETIRVIRDNDLIEIEPKPKQKAETKQEVKVKQEPGVANKAEESSAASGHSSASHGSENKKNSASVKSEYREKPGPKSKKRKLVEDYNEEQQAIEKPPYSKVSSNELKSLLSDFRSEDLELSQGSTVRKARERKSVQTSAPSSSTSAATSTATSTASAAPKSKKKRPTKEATEPVDRFSPIIILDRHLIPNSDDSQTIQTKVLKPSNGYSSKKQSARKSFPNPKRNVSNDTNSVNIEKELENFVLRAQIIEQTNDKSDSPKPIEFDNCQPMADIPIAGDIIAFKMMTLSADGNGFECSPFKMGSVLCVDPSTQMVDILFQDILKRSIDKLSAFSKPDDQTLDIHSLKIDWSTVLEPKLIQKVIENGVETIIEDKIETNKETELELTKENNREDTNVETNSENLDAEADEVTILPPPVKEDIIDENVITID